VNFVSWKAYKPPPNGRRVRKVSSLKIGQNIINNNTIKFNVHTNNEDVLQQRRIDAVIIVYSFKLNS
jgi:hypothetical protein